MPNFTWIGTARVNTDHIVSIEPKAHTQGNPRWTVTLTDGRTYENDHDLADESGTIIPALPGLVLVEAFPPRPSDRDQTVDYDTTAVVALRVFAGVEPSPISLRGSPPSDRPWAVIQPDGQCISWGDSWDSLDAFKRSCEQEFKARSAEAAANEPAPQAAAPMPESISSAPEPAAGQGAETDPLLALRAQILAEPIQPVSDEALWRLGLDHVAVIDAVRRANPSLHYAGVGYNVEWGWKWDSAQIERERETLTLPAHVEEFDRALRFLSYANRKFPLGQKSSQRTSYSWKHAAERVMGDYVSNGMLLTAAYALGFKVWPNRASPNPRINLSEKAIALDPGKGM